MKTCYGQNSLPFLEPVVRNSNSINSCKHGIKKKYFGVFFLVVFFTLFVVRVSSYPHGDKILKDLYQVITATFVRTLLIYNSVCLIICFIFQIFRYIHYDRSVNSLYPFSLLKSKLTKRFLNAGKNTLMIATCFWKKKKGNWTCHHCQKQSNENGKEIT